MFVEAIEFYPSFLKNSIIPKSINALVVSAKKELYVIKRGTSANNLRGSSVPQPQTDHAYSEVTI